MIEEKKASSRVSIDRATDVPENINCFDKGSDTHYNSEETQRSRVPNTED